MQDFSRRHEAVHNVTVARKNHEKSLATTGAVVRRVVDQLRDLLVISDVLGEYL